MCGRPDGILLRSQPAGGASLGANTYQNATTSVRLFGPGMSWRLPDYATDSIIFDIQDNFTVGRRASPRWALGDCDGGHHLRQSPTQQRKN